MSAKSIDTYRLSYANAFYKLYSDAAVISELKVEDVRVEDIQNLFAQKIVPDGADINKVTIEEFRGVDLDLIFITAPGGGDYLLHSCKYDDLYAGEKEFTADKRLEEYSKEADKFDKDNSCKFSDIPEPSILKVISGLLNIDRKIWYGAAIDLLKSIDRKVWYGGAAAVATLAVLSFSYMRSR